MSDTDQDEMKRKRSGESERQTEIQSAIEELAELRPGFDRGCPEDTVIPTMKFLRVCSLVVQVLDKIGPTMAVLRQDIHQNIQRLEKLCEADPLASSNLVEILKKETSESSARKTSSCCRAFLWLTRAMDFTVTLLQKLASDPCQSMEQAVEESYIMTLKPWHGWISAAAYKVALKLLPESKPLLDILRKKDDSFEALQQDIETLASLLVPLLARIHSALEYFGLDRLKST